MSLSELTSKNLTVICDGSTGKEALLEKLVSIIYKEGVLSDFNTALSSILSREKLGTTGIGEGVAVPHSKLSNLSKPILLVAVCRDGVDFESVDHIPVNIIFVLFTPERETTLHLKILSSISKLIKLTRFKERILSDNLVTDVYSVLCEEDKGI